MSLSASLSTLRQTTRFTLSEAASEIIGYGTPAPMSHIEEKISRIRGVKSAVVQSWSVPFVIDVEIDALAAAEHDLEIADVEDHVGEMIDCHVDDWRRLEKFVARDGCYPRDRKLVVSADDCLVLRNSDGGFSVLYEKDGDIVDAVIEENDYLVEIVNDLIDDYSANPHAVARGTRLVSDWVSRHARGLSWYPNAG
jgi:hypothetical protein